MATPVNLSIENESLPLRPLGRSNLMVPPIGLGGAGLGGIYGEVHDRIAVQTVQWAVEHGVTFIDTDSSYGESERRIGLALSEGDLRHRVVLSTKTGTHPDHMRDFSYDGTMWNVENSLRVLGTGYIDLVMVHDPPAIEPVMEKRGALAALEELKSQGLIRAIGLGQRRHDFHRIAIESGRVDVILTFNDYNPVRTTAADWLLPLAAKHNVGVINGSPLLMGLLTGEDPELIPEDERFEMPPREFAMAKKLYNWCRERDVPMVPLVFQFSLRNRCIHSTISGVKTVEELRQNVEAVTTPLPEEIWRELEALNLTADQTQPDGKPS